MTEHPPTILFIDDEQAVRFLAAEGLKLLGGYHTIQAESGSAAIESLEEFGAQIDLIVLDLTMPQMSGEETYALLSQRRPDIPIILSSGHEPDNLIERFDPPPAGFLQKPYRPQTLFETIQRVLTQHNP